MKESSGKIIKQRPMPYLPEMPVVQLNDGKFLNIKGEPSLRPYHFDNDIDAQKALNYYDNQYNTEKGAAEREDKKNAAIKAEQGKEAEKRAQINKKSAQTKAQNKTRVHLSGNTFYIKDELKSKFKAKWDAELKKWTVPAEYEEAANEMIKNHEESLEAKKRKQQQEKQTNKPLGIHEALNQMSGNPANNRDIIERLNRQNARNKLAQKEFMNPWDE